MEAARIASQSVPSMGQTMAAAVQPPGVGNIVDMVAPGLPFQVQSTATTAYSLAAAGGTIDYNSLKHLQWSPRKQPQRVILLFIMITITCLEIS